MVTVELPKLRVGSLLRFTPGNSKYAKAYGIVTDIEHYSLNQNPDNYPYFKIKWDDEQEISAWAFTMNDDVENCSFKVLVF